MLNQALGMGLTLVGKDQASPAINAVNKGLVDLRKGIVKTRDDIGRFTSDGKHAFASASTGMRQSLFKMHESGLQARESVAGLFGDVQRLGKGAAITGVAGLGVALGAAFKSGELTDALAGLKVVSGATASEMEMLRKTSLDMGTSTEFSASQVAVSLTDIASAGYTATQSVDLLRPSLDLATASLGQLSASDAAAVTAQTLKAFGLESKQAGPSVDKLVKSMNLFAVQAKDLPLGLANSVRGASAFNQTLDETLVSFGLVKNIIPRVETAATAVSVAMERMVDPSIQKDLKKLGVDVIDPMTKKFRPFLDVVSDMAPALDEMGSTKASGFLQQTFGPEALTGINAILTQVRSGITTQTGEVLKGGAALRYLRGEIGGAKGTAGEFSGELSRNLPGIMRQLRAAGTTFIQMLGEPLAEAIRPAALSILAGIRSMADALRSLPKETVVVAARVFMLAAALTTLVGGLLAARAAWNIYRAGMLAVQATSIATASSLLPILVGVALVGTAVAGLKVAVDQNIGGIGDMWERTGGKISLVFRALSQHFSQGFISGAVADELKQSGNGGLLGFVGRLVNYAERAKSALAGVGEGFTQGMGAIRPVLKELTTELEKVGITFNGLLPKEGQDGLVTARSSGQSLGIALAKLAGFAARGAVVLIGFARAVGTVVGAAVSLIDRLGGVNTILTVLEYAFVGMLARSAAGAVISLVAIGTSALASAGGVTGLAGSLAALRGMSIASAATSIAGGIGSITKSAMAANGPLLATTAALVALYAAMDQASKLGSELGEDGFSDMVNKLRYDVGIDSQEEYQRNLGIKSGYEAHTAEQFRANARNGGSSYMLGESNEPGRRRQVLADGRRSAEVGVSALDRVMAMEGPKPVALPAPAAPAGAPQSVEAMLKGLGADKATADLLRQAAQMQLEAAQINREAADARSSASVPIE